MESSNHNHPISLDDLAEFLVRAKLATYAGEGTEVEPERFGFKELEYKEGNLGYRDSYSGYFQAPGQEVVRLDGMPIWTMSYHGGMVARYIGNHTYAQTTFTFLKEALSKVAKEKPFRGPTHFEKLGWKYSTDVLGDITNFNGTEFIQHNQQSVFVQSYFGGLIIPKSHSVIFAPSNPDTT